MSSAKRQDTKLKWTIYIVAMFCGLVFVVSKVDSLGKLFVSDSASYGDLYPELGVRDFKTERGPRHLPQWGGRNQVTPDSAEFILIGDSFLGTGGDRYPCGDELAIALDAPLIWLENGDPQRYPLRALRGAGVHPDKERKVLLLECVERNFMYKYLNFTLETAEETPAAGRSDYVAGALSLARQIRDVWFSGAELRYQYLLNTSVFTAGFMEGVNTFKYRQFDMMPQRFPVYSTNPPMVFSFFETDKTTPLSYFYQHSDREIVQIAENLHKLAKVLDRDWNIELYVIPIPNKLTVYHELATDVPYNNYLPRLQAELGMRGVSYVDVYSPFVLADERLYHLTDTHWNNSGMMLAVKEVAKAVGAAGTIQPKTS